jgi:FkbM family methyltransferase
MAGSRTPVRARLRTRLEWIGFRTLYRIADLTYALGIATPKRTVAGTYWSYEPTNPHDDDPGLAALDSLPDDATVLDVGAHVGEHAIPLARGTDREVVAFEPNGESADRLARNARRNGFDVGADVAHGSAHGAGPGGSIALRRAGVGDANTTLSFYRSTFSKCSAFDRDRATRWGAAVDAVEPVPIRRLDDLVEGVGEGGVEVGAIDEGDSEVGPTEPEHPRATAPIPAPDAIKVDVEGHELAVLRGATATIARYRPLLVIEVHDETADDGDGTVDRLREWLAERHYAVEEAGAVWICRG